MLLCLTAGVAVSIVAAQTPASKPSGTIQQRDAARPPGSNDLPPPQTPPSTQPVSPQNQNPADQTPTPATLLNQLKQDPIMKNSDVRPTPPVPPLVRIGVQSDNILSLSLNDAIRRALENNSDIEVARGDVKVAEGTLTSLQGVYDPVFAFNPQITSSVTPTTSSIGGAGASGTVTLNSQQFNSTFTKQFATGGGQYQLFFNNTRLSTDSTFSRLNPFYSSSFGITFTQPLLRDRSIDRFRHDIRIQRKKLQQSDSDFRLRTIQIIDSVQHAYWELRFALHAQQVAIDSLNLAREQFRVTELSVAAGTVARLNRAEVDTQIATSETNLLIATRNVTTAENTFKQLVLRDPTAPEWQAEIMPTDAPVDNVLPINLSDALAEARANRPELLRLRLQEDINKVDVQFAKNQTLPRVDIVSTISTTGLAGTPATADTLSSSGVASGATSLGQVPLITGDPNSSATAFLLSQVNQIRAAQGLIPATVPFINVTPNSVPSNLIGGYPTTLGNLFSLGTRNIVAGVTIQLPLHNRAAKGNLAVALSQRDQLVASIHSEEQAVELDVRNSVQALETARQTVMTARQATHSAELQLAGELQLFHVGQSTTFLVFQRENTLATARNSELRAQADLNNALADLQRAMGTTLRTNNIMVEPPTTP